MAKFFKYDRIPKNWGKIVSFGILLLILSYTSGINIGNAQQTSEILIVRISTSLDDVEERSSDGTMYMDSSDLELGDDADWYGDHLVGLRFQNVTIPSGAIIQDAYLEFESDETRNTPTSVEIYAEDVDHAASFSTSNYNLSSRSLTVISSIWEIPPWNTVNEKHLSPDISEVVQEVVNRAGWASGNSMVFVIDGTGTRTAESYDGEPIAAPLLHVEYTVGHPTSTQTDLPTNTPFHTYTPSPSPLPSDTASPIPTPVPTGTPTHTPTYTFTPTPIYSDTPTPTQLIDPTGLVVWPYLGETTTHSISVSWATDRSGDSEVRYSLDQSYNNVTIAADQIYDGKHWHSATITGLSEDTTYFYKIFTNNQDLTPWTEITFSTAPSSSTSPFTFVAFGDSRSEAPYKLPNPAAWEVAAELELHQFDFVIHSGDLVHSGGICSGDDSSWNQYIRTYFDLYKETLGDSPFLPAIGGHELLGDSCGYQAYTELFQLPTNAPVGYKEQYYSFDWGNTHISSLDVYQDFYPGSPQYNWLINDLQTTSQTWKIVIFHEPPYSAGANGSSLDIRNQLVPVFETYGVDVVFNGHEHAYQRTCPILNNACTTTEDGGVVYLVTGGAGANLYNVDEDWFTLYADSIHHFTKVEVTDCRMRFEAISNEGNIFDSYEINYCGTIPTYTPSPTPVGGNSPTPTATAYASPTPTIPPSGIIDLRISSSADDVEERASDGTINLVSSDLELGEDTEWYGVQSVGLRFSNLSIPQGATILSAYLEFETDETGNDPTTIEIRAQASDHALEFTTTPYNLTNRPTTAASILWDVPAWNVIDQKHPSPDISILVQEVVNRTGWQSGNDLVLVIDGIGKRTSESYDGEATAAPLLHVEYATGPPTPTQFVTATPSLPPPTSSPRPSATHSFTPTSTWTVSPTPPLPPTYSPTPTDIPASTSTPAFTVTPTSAPPATNTPTPSDLPTSTPTPSSTDTPTSAPPPTNTPTPSDIPTTTPTPTATLSPTPTPTPTPSPGPSSNALIYVSSSSSGTAGGISFDDEDIILYDVATGSWSMYFDGSDVGLSRVDLNAFTFLPDGSILMSFNTALNLQDLGVVDDSDIIRFIPDTTGNNTSGTFMSYLYGSNSDLSKNSEDIDAISFTPEGYLALSTTGSLEVTGVSGEDEDLIILDGDGNGSMYFDGSDLGFGKASSDDINGIHIDPNSNQIYLTTNESFSIPGISGNGEDIILCIPETLGSSTSCSLQSYWIGALHDFDGKIVDGIHIIQ
jgi:hypothetical protein